MSFNFEGTFLKKIKINWLQVCHPKIEKAFILYLKISFNRLLKMPLPNVQ